MASHCYLKIYFEKKYFLVKKKKERFFKRIIFYSKIIFNTKIRKNSKKKQ